MADEPSLCRAYREVQASIIEDVNRAFSELGIGRAEALAVTVDSLAASGLLPLRSRELRIGTGCFIEGLATGIRFQQDRAKARERSQ